MHRFEKLNILSIIIYELDFYQDGDNSEHKVSPVIIKNESDEVFDLLIYKNHYALIKKLHVLLGNHNKSLVC